MGAWQTLLLVKGEVVSGHDHFTASPSFAAIVGDTLKGLATPMGTPDAQARGLACLLKLWGVLTNVFTCEWLYVVARIVSEALLQNPFAVADNRVRDLWARVSRELTVPSLLDDLCVRAVDPTGVDAVRKMWFVTAQSGCFGYEGDNLRDGVRFLAIPIGYVHPPLFYHCSLTLLSRNIELGICHRWSTRGGQTYWIPYLESEQKANNLRRLLYLTSWIIWGNPSLPRKNFLEAAS